MDNKLRLLVSSVIIVLLATSCQQEEILIPATQGEGVADEIGLSGVQRGRVTMAELLAKALQDKEVQTFFQKEAAKQFDKDTDVLLALVKDKPFGRNSHTLTERLGKINGNIERVKGILTTDPLITVFVPSNKANIDWSSQAPKVAVHDEQRTDNKIAVYDQQRQVSYWSMTEEPDQPVVVIKTCERITITDIKNARASKSTGRIVGTIVNGLSLQLSNVAFDPEVRTNARVADHTSNDKVRKAHNKRVAGGGISRDYIYYDIDPPAGINDGMFNENFIEAVTGIQLRTDEAFEKIGGWAEGNPELHLIFFLRNSRGGVISTRKVISVYSNNLVQEVTGPWHFKYYKKIYAPSMPITIAPFNPQDGNTWAVKAIEHDPGQASHSIEQSISFNTTAYTNFENVEVIPFSYIYASKKIGGYTGGRGTESFNLTANYTTTDNSDDLGVAYHSYEWDVLQTYITRDATETGMLYAPLGAINPVTKSNHVSTGSINIYIEPVR
jgi:hypothetical protein